MNVVFELDLLGHGGEEPVFDPLLIQQGQGAVGGPQFVACDQLGGDALNLHGGHAAGGVYPNLFLNMAPGIHQTFQQDGVKSPAFPPQDHPHGFLVGIGGFVYPFAGQGVIDVCQRDHLGGDGDVLPFETVGIPTAVIPFMVPTADVMGHPDQLLLLEVGGILQNLCPDGTVGFHNGKFLIGQPARFVEDILRDGDFADVMEGRGVYNQGNFGGGQVVPGWCGPPVFSAEAR